MVYANINLSTDNTTINAMAGPAPSAPTGKSVRVYYNNIPLDAIAGPVPLIDLSTEYNTTAGGQAQSMTTKVNIIGKILKTKYYNPETSSTPAKGTADLVAAMNKLKDIFKCNNGIFAIKCGESTLIEGSGVNVKSAKFDKSSDNWLFTSDYAIELEYSEPIPSKSNEPLIKTGSDSWSLEPLEDSIYMEMWKANGVNQKSEYHNPKLGANGGASTSAGVPSADVNAPALGPALSFITLPQFKLSRTIYAVGLSNTSNTGNCGSGVFPAYHQAKKWVEIQIGKGFKAAVSSGTPTVGSSEISSIGSLDKLFLYNHLRNIDLNHVDGSYKVVDTWLAMPTGVSYIEDYTIESSTDLQNIKSVRVQGNIKGLSISLPMMTGSSGLVLKTDGVLDLSDYYNTRSSAGTFASPPKKLDSRADATNAISSHKYMNAYSGWINDIKPFLYRRACSITNSLDRNTSYIASVISPPPPPNNPIYSYERLLNIIPVSTSETLDPRKGTVSYSYEFSNKFSLFKGVLSENITISNNMPADIVNEAFVIGRQLGPVLQYMGTTTSATKSVTIELVVPPPSSMKGCLLTNSECPLYIYGPTYSGVKALVSGLRPFGQRLSIFGNMSRPAVTGSVQVTKDDVGWNPAEGKFVRSVEWVYQPCGINVSLVSDLLKDL